MWWSELSATADQLATRSGGGIEVDITAHVASTAILAGAIKVGARSRICHGAFIEGPVEIGADCLIGNLALVRGPTRIGGNSRIGFATEIKKAVIGCGARIGPQCFVADSVLREGVYLGAQVRTSNHRLDRKTVTVIWEGSRVDTKLEKLGCLIGERASLGIQVIVLPGRVIPPDTQIGPGIIVEKNLPAGKYRLSQSLARSRSFRSHDE
jgi:bifunctional UDP-N-acetylglucosamine pyrophosphorylase/glucosamine-1-phosphate N-acetyltransferase